MLLLVGTFCFQAEQEKLVTRQGVLQKEMLVQLDSCNISV